MEEQLTPTQTQYLKERGFQIIEQQPSREQPFPHLTLREQQQFFEEAEITYHYSSSSRTGIGGITHPSTTPSDELINIIENAVAYGSEMEGKLYNTTPGQPIKIFVLDPAWKEIAETLAAKYK